MAIVVDLPHYVKVLEGIEKLRVSCEIKLKSLSRNKLCLQCWREFMPKSFELCPECGSTNSRKYKIRRICRDCGHRWEPGKEICPYCLSANFRDEPKDDPLLRTRVVPLLQELEDSLEKFLVKVVKEHPVWTNWASGIKGLGAKTLARLIGKPDIRKIETISSFWALFGWALKKFCPRCKEIWGGTSGSCPKCNSTNIQIVIQRKRAGAKLDYIPKLQSSSVIMGECLVKAGGKFYDYFVRERDLARKVVRSPGHAHNRGFRHMIKMVLACLYMVWRVAEGLPLRSPYPHEKLGHTSILLPQDFLDKEPEERGVLEEIERMFRR